MIVRARIPWYDARSVSAQFAARSEAANDAPAAEAPIPVPTEEPTTLSAERVIRAMARLNRERSG